MRMRIGTIARAAGLSRETIHFYLREGLLPPPEKVNARVAYFDAGHLARLRLIKRLQQAHLPLAVIREQLTAIENWSAEEIAGRFLPRLLGFLAIDGDEPELSSDLVAAHGGLTPEQLARLEALDVVQPTLVNGQPLYTRADAEAVAAARTLLDQGVELDALRFVRRYGELIEQEHAFLLHYVIRPAELAGRREQVSATVAEGALRLIEAYLRRQFRRRYGLISTRWAVLADPLDDSTPPGSGPAQEPADRAAHSQEGDGH